jgi:hypothetical protein
MKVRVINNSLNIGAGLNIAKAIDNSASDYLWLLADDDIPALSCIRQIIADIARYSPIALKYSSKISSFGLNKCLGLAEVLSLMRSHNGYFSNFLFLSTWVFSSSVAKSYVPILQKLSFAESPQICFPILFLSENSSGRGQSSSLIHHSSFELIEHVPPGGWSVLSVYPKLLILSLLLSEYSPSTPPLSLFWSFYIGLGLTSPVKISSLTLKQRLSSFRLIPFVGFLDLLLFPVSLASKLFLFCVTIR